MEIRDREFNLYRPQDTETLCREGTMFTTLNLCNKHNTGEKNTMLKIERAVLINGQRAAARSPGSVLELLEKETRCIERLEALNLKSEAIDKIKARHQANIEVLVEVLETKGDADD